MSATNSTLSHVYCPKCNAKYSHNELLALCKCGAPLLVDYDYDRASKLLTKEKFRSRSDNMWRCLEVLPVQDKANIVSFGEGGTPVLPSVSVGKTLGMTGLYFKDETVNPTGSFKARGLGMAVSRAKELGAERLVVPSAGNAGSALAAYAARAQLRSLIIMPKDVPAPFLVDCVYHGAEVELVEGTIKDCGARAAERSAAEGWFSIATLKEPYRIEGKKTMGYELAEQFDYKLPDVVIYPTGGGTGLIGMWKAFNEMEKMGWLGKDRPRMVSVQAECCAPIPRAYAAGLEDAGEWPDPHTLAAGLRVPSAVGDFLMLRAIRETGGDAIAVSDAEIMADTKVLASQEGIFTSPEGGACLACLKRMLDSGSVKPTDSVVLFITGSGYKYLDVLEQEMK